MENCVFCRMIKGEIPAAKAWENENFLAFLSIAPHNPGHTLVIPKRHVDYIFDMEDAELSALTIACKKVASGLKKAFPPQTGKIGVLVMGIDVPHVHVHLIPVHKASDLNNDQAKHDIPFEEIKKNAEKIRQTLASQEDGKGK